ncbi:putative HTH-type transcriptional regulator [subsurface metagenome]
MKENILEIKAGVFNALAHPLRLKILEKLRDGTCCVCKIIPYVNGEQSNVSHHLAILRKAGIVRTEKRGIEVWYEVTYPGIFKMIDIVDECIIQNLSKSKDILRILAEEKK